LLQSSPTSSRFLRGVHGITAFYNDFLAPLLFVLVFHLLTSPLLPNLFALTQHLTRLKGCSAARKQFV
jgi:hypothetical protein